MSIYAIGDLQGCYSSLLKLLEKISFNPKKDKLWFTGDLVNRGHESLACLRRVKELVEKKQAITILGNHDLHLLAVASGSREIKDKDTFHDILEASDLDELLLWLRQQPLLHYDARHDYVMVHAGIPPHWTLADAQQYNTEITHILQGSHYHKLLQHMYSDEPGPRYWDNLLSQWERCRLIIDYFTRMRYIKEDGKLNLKIKGSLKDQPPGYYPWFRVPNRVNSDLQIIFGHWASLRGEIDDPGIFALDTGCIWGNCLTAMRLEDQKRFAISCAENKGSGNED